MKNKINGNDSTEEQLVEASIGKEIIAGSIAGVFYTNKVAGAVTQGLMGDRRNGFKNNVIKGFADGLVKVSSHFNDSKLANIKNQVLKFDIPVLMASSINPQLATIVAKALQAKATSNLQLVLQNQIDDSTSHIVSQQEVRDLVKMYMCEEYTRSFNKNVELLEKENDVFELQLIEANGLVTEIYESDYSFITISFVDITSKNKTKIEIKVAVKAVIYKEKDELLVDSIMKLKDAGFKDRLNSFREGSISFTNLLLQKDISTLKARIAKSLGVTWLERVKKGKVGTCVVINKQMANIIKMSGFDLEQNDAKLKTLCEKLGIMEFFIVDEDTKLCMVMDDSTYTFNTMTLGKLYSDSKDVIKRAEIIFKA